MKAHIFKCDGCGKVKGEVNHWYSVIILKSGVLIMTFSDEERCEHFCGEECVLRMIARNLPK